MVAHIWSLLIASALVSNSFAAITVEQMTETVATFRSMCQPKFKIPDDVADGLKQGKYPDNKDVKCYVNCIMEMMRVSKKGKLLYDASVKQINTMLPENLREVYISGLDTCKESSKGIKDSCEAAYEMFKCFNDSNPKFIFP